MVPAFLEHERGALEPVPEDWSLLPPGDAALSRRIKQDGPTLTVIDLKGRKRFSRGIWAPRVRIEALRAELQREREDPAYQKQLDAGRRRRAAAEEDYAVDFRDAVFRFLNFQPQHAHLARTVANLIADHATPVGSGTVARTQRIPLEARAEAATIAWLRHQTTGYDGMVIPREKGRRREVRRMLAQRSVLHWAEDLPRATPILLVQGGRDERVDPASGPRLKARLDELGHPNKMVVYPEDNHSLHQNWDRARGEIIAWFRAHARQAPAPVASAD